MYESPSPVIAVSKSCSVHGTSSRFDLCEGNRCDYNLQFSILVRWDDSGCALTLQFFFWSPCCFCFPIFLAFLCVFLSFSKGFRASAKRKTLAFFEVSFFFSLQKKQGLEGQGRSRGGGGVYMREMGAICQIGVFTWKPCTFWVKNRFYFGLFALRFQWLWPKSRFS